ncbi:hypothetical protein [Kineosporia sp. NBRC 101731]|uniref:hypothetical protein n=1 Tax=Kineosporia sp. NBRC 101731 TaxID=3032199 RepID=UPI0024A3732C|nr:hypothetical protein [Kineosporia sp. NBRC 101731]GLY32018.1 hypothetical protein Kisp02_53830 [Kineosporia sp. NBRC 101731]
MSAHLLIVAGYMDIPEKHKLALMKICDSADDGSRIGYPGLDAIRAWTGAARSQALAILVDLQKWGLLMQVEQGHRGRRASYKVFPDAGDEKGSLSVRRGGVCPGADAFKGSPGIPKEEELAHRLASADTRRATERKAKGSSPDRTLSVANGSSPDRTHSEVKGPAQTGPFLGAKGPAQGEKGSGIFDKGSGPDRTPSVPYFGTTTSSQAADAAWADDEPSDGLFEIARPDPPEAAPAQVLVAAYCDAVEASGGMHTTSMRGAIGRHVKRLIKDDGIDLPVLLVAVQRAGAARARDVDRFLGEAHDTYAKSDQARRAMFAAWERLSHPAATATIRQIGA